jgi:FkbM family methyltransferase
MNESGESKLLEHLARRWTGQYDITVVDVGAHRGAYALAVQSAFGARAQVFCFEPDQVSFEALERQVDANARIRCFRLALGRTPRTARLFTDRGGSPLASLHSETLSLSAEHSESVRVETLDRISQKLRMGQIDLLKVDVEGQELSVLEGAQRLFEEGAIGVVQFEFGERNLASRSYLRDFIHLLGPEYELFRLSPRGLARVDYRTSCEVFLLETNYVAVKTASDTSDTYAPW